MIKEYSSVPTCGQVEALDGEGGLCVVYEGAYLDADCLVELPCGHDLNLSMFIPLPEGCYTVVNGQVCICQENWQSLDEQLKADVPFYAGYASCPACVAVSVGNIICEVTPSDPTD
jgi:hypothetical protein